ncbi:MAG: hypothetical protein J1E00_06825, partial [Oscillospiraceae bacterium]|nr:hypothetical protein [Oscillospiraceae bacterium]
EYETLGRPDGVKSDVKVPKNGFLVCVSVTDDTQPLKDKVNVGHLVVLDGVDVDALSALKPNENPLAGTAKVSFYTAKVVEDEPTVEPTNVALGKEVTKKVAPVISYYDADLTDGIAATTMSYDKGVKEWFSFYYNENYADQVNVERVEIDGTMMNVGNVVVDLADYYDVNSIRIHYNKDYLPQITNIYVSTNGKTYTKVLGKTTTVADGVVTGAGCWVEFPLDEVSTAKYVKVECVFPGMFAMLNEIEVYGVPSDYEPEEEWAPSEEGDWTIITDENGTVQTPEVGVNGLAFAYTVDADTEYVYITFETNGAPHNVDATLDTFDAIRVTGTAIRIYLEVGEAGKFDKLLDTVVIDGKAVAH